MTNPHTVPNCCPFCGSSGCSAFECDVSRWAVSCAACGAIGPTAPSMREAIHLWNSVTVARITESNPRSP